MYVGQEAVIKITWRNKRYKWFRVSEFKKTASIVGYFRRLNDFHYAALYEYNRKNKSVGEKIGYFGQNYAGGIFNGL